MCDSYDLVNELPCPSLPKRRAKTKQKVTKVYRDSESLVNIGLPDWLSKLKIIQSYPIVQEFNLTAADAAGNQAVKVYNVDWARQQKEPHSSLASIEYLTKPALKAGPLSFLWSLRERETSCSNCVIAKTVVQDLVHTNAVNENKITELRNQMESVDLDRTFPKEDTTSVLDWAFRLVQKDNQALRGQVDSLEELLAEARTQQEDKPQTNSVSVETSCEQEHWIIKDPKRLARIKKVVSRQSRTVQLLRKCNEAKSRQIAKLQEENLRLRQLVIESFDTSEKFRQLAEELTVRIRSILAERAKSHTNQWRQFARSLQESTTQTSVPRALDEPDVTNGENNMGATDSRTTSPSDSDSTSSTTSDISQVRPDTREALPGTCEARPETCEARPGNSVTAKKLSLKNKQISKVLRSEKPPRSKFYKGRHEEAQCPICSFKFPRKTDSRMIEEHIEVHKRMKY